MSKKRFHDGHDKRVPLRRLPHFFVSASQSARRKMFGYYPRLPWIPFAAAARLDALVKPADRVWEIGAGYSTLWLADRVAKVTSIEADENWYDTLSGIVVSEQLDNVDLRYVWRADEMSSFDADGIDLLYVDGGPRRDCLINGAAHVRPGGLIYCDNTDTPEFWGDSGFAASLESIAYAVASVEFISDYVPGMVAVNEGAIIRLKF
jgi:predicted O-methyltransferase YrrM